MTTENEQITPADAAIVSSGTGTKGPEERDLLMHWINVVDYE